ncbi:5'-deoxynucleotidase [Acrasis kona]|uniref:5'-deoxynucleotidase n=1 Tax=Acrasis kona TaxID=1008807 RepID=A0AAW2YXG5_9EUKA
MSQRAQNIVSFLKFCGKLKHLLRTGWVDHKVNNPETVASHMHRMGIISMLSPEVGVDRERCIKMCLVHDIAESIVGDITPHAGVSDEDKYNQEKSAMEKFKALLLKDIDQNSEENKEFVQHVEELIQLWNEYEDLSTPEAILVKDIDRFDMILQALEYEDDQNTKLETFFNSTNGKFKTDFIKDLAQAVYQQRKK